MLPTDATERKDTPIYSGFVKYFPLAMAEVARLSKAGNDQHNPGKPLHWDRSKSGDEMDALQRHTLEAGTIDTDGQRHSAKVAWRAMANLEKELEKARTATEQAEESTLTYEEIQELYTSLMRDRVDSMCLSGCVAPYKSDYKIEYPSFTPYAYSYPIQYTDEGNPFSVIKDPCDFT